MFKSETYAEIENKVSSSEADINILILEELKKISSLLAK